ncbi:Uncharacterised protein [Plesiomonas shigelloides]|uniref:hypothetical protein n=1 Tax=Plesiomonas shigelloides TaxID=703 RepID=UPI0007ED5D8E|nr:hypothetical protein [Plesiomonas shigelloides]SBT62334.1 Uncharacterised protein [Plesiomonas shigelloides]
MKKIYLTAVAAVFSLSSAMSFAATGSEKMPEKAPAHTTHHSAVVKHHKTATHKKVHQAKLNTVEAKK